MGVSHIRSLLGFFADRPNFPVMGAPGRQRRDRQPLLAPAFYFDNLARSAKEVEILAIDSYKKGGLEVEKGQRVNQALLESFAAQIRNGRSVPRVNVRHALMGKDIAERVQAMLKRQSDVRQLHEKGGFSEAWNEIAPRLEIPEPLGGLLQVMAAVWPRLFTQSLLGGYLSAAIAWELRMPTEERVEAFLAGLCRDVGMLYLSPRLLDEADDQHFDGDSWTEVQAHVVLSYRILEVCKMSAAVKSAVLCHHERVDSTGYPRALWGRDVPFLGQLTGFADIASTVRVKRFFGSGRNLRDTLTILQLNMDSFDPKIGKAFSDIILRSKLKTTSFIPHDRDTMLSILKQRAGLIRQSMLQLKEVVEDRRTKNRSSKGHILRGSVERALSNLQRSGHSDQDFVWWLGLVAAGKESVDMHQLAEIDLQQVELLWQLRRVRQELFKAVPSLSYKTGGMAI